MSGDIAKQAGSTQPAYTIRGWAEACQLSESDVRVAISSRTLQLRRTDGGSLVVTGEDGLAWLRNLPLHGDTD